MEGIFKGEKERKPKPNQTNKRIINKKITKPPTLIQFKIQNSFQILRLGIGCQVPCLSLLSFL